MTVDQTATTADLRRQVEADDLSAEDELATLLYNQRKLDESANLYLKAFVGGFYKGNPKPNSERNFFGMIDKGVISTDSAAARFVRERRKVSSEVTERANRAAGQNDATSHSAQAERQWQVTRGGLAARGTFSPTRAWWPAAVAGLGGKFVRPHTTFSAL